MSSREGAAEALLRSSFLLYLIGAPQASMGALLRSLYGAGVTGEKALGRALRSRASSCHLPLELEGCRCCHGCSLTWAWRIVPAGGV